MPTPGDLLSTVRRVELVARKNVTSILSGNYVTSIPGRGLEFHEARRYLAGDPVRQIDWKMTARLNTPYVRTYLEERQREVVLAIDTSPSMHTGWQARTKLETAIEIAATVAVSAAEAGDRLGWLTFSDRVHRFARPASGTRQLFRALRELAACLESPPVPCDESDPRAAFHAIQALRGRRFVVFVVSDFIDHDIPDDVRYVQRRHDVSLIHVYDPLEYETSPGVRLPARSPEGAPGLTSVRPGETGTLADMRRFLLGAARRHGIHVTSIATDAAIGGALSAYFHHRGRRMAS